MERILIVIVGLLLFPKLEVWGQDGITYKWDYPSEAEKRIHPELEDEQGKSSNIPYCFKEERLPVTGPSITGAVRRELVSLDMCGDHDTFWGLIPDSQNNELMCVPIAKSLGIVLPKEVAPEAVEGDNLCAESITSPLEGRYFSQFFEDQYYYCDNLAAKKGIPFDPNVDLFVTRFMGVLAHKSFVELLSPKARKIFLDRYKVIRAIHGELSSSRKMTMEKINHFLQALYAQSIAAASGNSKVLVREKGSEDKCSFIDYKNMLIGTGICLGSGAFKPVYKFITQDGRTAAASITHKAREGFKKKKVDLEFEAAQKEASILQQLPRDARGIVPPVLVTVTSNYVLMASELYNRGTLDHFLKDSTGSDSLSDKENLKLAVDVGKGLITLHKLGIIHRDIKSKNVVVHENPDGSKKAGIIDYGVSYGGKVPPPEASDMQGTPSYMAPEIIARNQIFATDSGTLTQAQIVKQRESWTRNFPNLPYRESLLTDNLLNNFELGKKADLWALGVTFYEMAAKKSPTWIRNATNPMALIYKVGNSLNQREIDQALEEDIPKGHPLLPLIRCLLDMDVEKRCSDEEVDGFLNKL